ncbi:DUF883 family protein [Aureimonas frigidaquae]|uniref:DUF883 family protein n=1 Tax=Aureimonas frigidaquae TaxID=424757 RepID=UPI000784FDB7|nr:DUF883 family protein [Aureimonas frigidaquae]
MSTTNPNEAAGKGRSDANQADLEAQVKQLREDLANVTETLKGVAGNRASSARDQAFALKEDIKETGEQYFRQAQETVGELEEQLSERVRAEPLKSVLIAAAIGYFYARIFKN